MSVNKVIYGNQTLIDISDSTVTADKLSSGITAYDKAGNKITGTNTAGNVYKGTFTISNAKTVTVTGFNFTPKYIMFAMKTLSG